MITGIKWLDKAKEEAYQVYKKDPEAYYKAIKESGIWFKKHMEAVNRLAYHVWQEKLGIKNSEASH